MDNKRGATKGSGLRDSHISLNAFVMLNSLMKIVRPLPLLLWLTALCSAATIAFSASSVSREQSGVSINVVEIHGLRLRAAQESGPALLPGAVSKRNIAGTEIHSFNLALTAGQYARVVVEQKDIDLLVTIFKPDAQKLMEVGNPAGARGAENVSLMAETAGNYRLEVRPVEKWAAPGSYEIRVEEVRVPTEADKSLYAAEKLCAEGRRQLLETNESKHAALDSYEQSLPLWRAAEERYEEANALHSIGRIYKSLGDLPKALEYYNCALSLRREIGNREGEAYTLGDIAAANRILGTPQKALPGYEAALRIFQETGNRRGEAYILASTGFAHFRMGNMEQALGFYQRALTIRRSEQERWGEANLLNNMAGVYDAWGDPEKVMELLKQASSLWQEVGDREGEATIINNVGKIYDDWGEWQNALENYNKALAIYRSSENRTPSVRASEAVELDNIGLLYASLGDSVRGLDYLQKALLIRQELKGPSGLGDTLSRIGYAYYLMDKIPEALKYYEMAVPYYQKAEDSRGLSFTLTAIGLAQAFGGNGAKALEYYRQALELQKEERQGQALTYDKMGQAYMLSGDTQKALEAYAESLRLWRAIKDPHGEARTLFDVASAERRRNNIPEAHKRIGEAINLVESLRTRINDYKIRIAYFAAKQDFYELDVDLKMRLHRLHPSEGYDAAALQSHERALARNLLDILSEAKIDDSGKANSQLFESKLSLQRKLNAKAAKQAGLLNDPNLLNDRKMSAQAAALEREINELVAAYDEVSAKIRAQNPRYATLTSPQPVGLKEIQKQLLDQDTILLEYALGDERSYLWAVTPTEINTYELPKRADIEKVAGQLRNLLTTRPQFLSEVSVNKESHAHAAGLQYWSQAATLSRMLLGPVAAQLGQKRLLIVADDELQYIPFAGLPIPAAAPAGVNQTQSVNPVGTIPLIKEHEIINLPSASTLAVLREETGKRRAAPKALAVLADPVFERDDSRISIAKREKTPAAGARSRQQDLDRTLNDVRIGLSRLQLSRQEAVDISSFVADESKMEALGFDANRATATSPQLGQYRIVHFATHGILNDVHPELSGIVLSLFDEQGRFQEDGFLRLHEIYNLRLPVEMVVLSACQTGLGKKMKGEGLVGLTRGFMYAGAPRVVSSLWKVDDEATALLMKRFYQGMFKENLSPAAALRAAQVAMWEKKRWSAPYYWSGFILQGEWK
jgi:CHAT domain-containing protein/tetratricopeptide (TPR) repeat protein